MNVGKNHDKNPEVVDEEYILDDDPNANHQPVQIDGNNSVRQRATAIRKAVKNHINGHVNAADANSSNLKITNHYSEYN